MECQGTNQSSLLMDIINGVNTVNLYYNKGIDINYKHSLYLELAARYNHKVIVQDLVKNGIIVEARESYAIQVSIWHGHKWIAKFLINHLLKERKPLHNILLIKASEYNQIDLVKLLIKHINIEPCLEICLSEAVFNGHITIVKYFMKKFSNIDVIPLISIASRLGHLSIVKYFIQRIEENQTSLHTAIPEVLRLSSSHDRLNILHYIIKEYPGCFSQEEVNNVYLNACRRRASSSILKELEKSKKINCYKEALEIAIEKKYDNLSRYLVSKCTMYEINEALLKVKTLDCLKVLFNKCADIHYKEEQLLKNAILDGNTHIIDYLIYKGANIHINNEEPLRLAFSNPEYNSSIIEYLITKGADIDLASAIILTDSNPNITCISNLALYYEDYETTDTECGICLMEFNKNTNLHVCKVCKHAVHKECQNKWKGACIYCRN